VLHEEESPLDPISVNLFGSSLVLDAQGGVRVHLAIGEEQRASADPDKRDRPAKGLQTKGATREFDSVWKIESISMEIVGQTADR
jgi:hypothetical protein